MPNKELEKLKAKEEKIEDKIKYFEHQQKIGQKKIKELTRSARTHRLCTRGGMLEKFLIRPSDITDEQVMKLLKKAFNQQAVKDSLNHMISMIEQQEIEVEKALRESLSE